MKIDKLTVFSSVHYPSRSYDQLWRELEAMKPGDRLDYAGERVVVTGIENREGGYLLAVHPRLGACKIDPVKLIR